MIPHKHESDPAGHNAVPSYAGEASTVDQAHAIDTKSQSTSFTLTGLPEIPGYEITHEIARGGMGRVLAGHETLLNREVAIKVLLPGIEASRFLTEAKITSQLPHPAIPPVYALGFMDNGAPYLAMKLVRGKTLAAVLETRSAPLQDLSRFLLVFEQIAQAVGFAHAQGIVHRDLKPANVMVGAFGEVQVMDWGLAKKLASTGGEEEPLPQKPVALSNATSPEETTAQETDDQKHDQTRKGDILGTPAFMAPEQARGEVVGIAADVFALGGILCAILTGKPVFPGKSGWDALQLAASGDTSDALARLDQCGADSELVKLAKSCLTIQATNRPVDGQRVAQLVAAYRHGLDERLKLAETERAEAVVRESEQRKRRRQLLVASAAIVAVLVAGIIGTGIGFLRAEEKSRQEEKAKLNAIVEKGNAIESKDQAIKNLGFARSGFKVLGKVFENVNPEQLASSKKSIQEVLQDNLRRAVKEVNDIPPTDVLTVAEMQHILGTSLLQMGDYKLSSQLFEKVHATHLAVTGPEHPDTLTNMNDLALSYELLGEYEKALKLHEQALPLVIKHFGNEDQRTLTLKANIANVLMSLGRHAEARPINEEVLRMRTEKLGPNHEETIDSLNNLAMCIDVLESPAKATKLYEEAYRRRLATKGPDHPQTLLSMNNMGKNLLDTNQYDNARILLQKTVDKQLTALGPDHPDRLTSMNQLAIAHQMLGQHGKALPLFEETLARRRRKLGNDHPDTQNSKNSLAAEYFFTRQFDKVMPLLKEALRYQQGTLGPTHEDTLLTLANLGIASRELGQFQESATYLRKAYPACANVPSLHWVGSELYVTLQLSKEREAAEKLLAELIADYRKKPNDNRVIAAGSWTACGHKLLKSNYHHEAEMLLQESHSFLESQRIDTWVLFANKALLGWAALGQKHHAKAEKLLLEGYQGLKQREKTILPVGRIILTESTDCLIQLYTETSKPDEMKKWQTEKAKLTKGNSQ